MIKEVKVKNKEVEEMIKVYCVDGKMYAIIAKLAEALDAKKADFYNAAARIGKDNIKKYIRVLTLNDASLSRPTVKCIDVEGLPVLFKKIERKVDSEKLKSTADFFNIDINIENSKESKSNIVEFNPITSEETVIDQNETIKNDVEISNKISDEVVKVSLDATVESLDNEKDDTENILDGILNIIEENKTLKEKVASLENEVKCLQEEVSKFNGNPLELESLRKENEFLKAKIKESEEKNSNLLNKANLIKKYIQSNK